MLRRCKTQSLGEHLHEMRLIKEDNEIVLMQKAADISIQAHQLAMQQAKIGLAGLFEYEVVSIFDAEFRKNNAEHAYTPIVAGGKNGCICITLKTTKCSMRVICY
ncbi:Xaa-Pro aminopeptidase (EC [uncultured Gammaproteobacteria bacterium]|nr:Xaa-Pro aminopeptidase (EC [uncultured Gammaproteobacteria bacterium]